MMRRRILPVRYLFPLLAVLAATVGIFVVAGRSIDRQRAEDRTSVAHNATAQIRARIEAAESSLYDTAAFFDSSDDVTRAEFHSFAQSPLDRPAIRSVSWVERVPASQRVAWERANRAEITELGRRGEIVRARNRGTYF